MIHASAEAGQLSDRSGNCRAGDRFPKYSCHRLRLLRAEDGFTDVTYVWRVRLIKRWMRWLAPLLAPVFLWNHEGVMRAGEAGLRRHLAMRDAG